ncbi:BTAD domain-containing putative transcriptional regulator [Actinokineospora pegani]|uniref:BTAD domain-containing putative transcriptional regulator n=1 Tax=Actinokineospora pegani TaxID=2654637 RepID=UPI0012EA9DC1|nr:BTAD domain-containing putative transcriptional regulator [Actinokineospora pegani]
MLRVEVLGPVRAWIGDDEVALGTARQRAAFSVLVGKADESVPSRELVDAVWGAGAPANAQGNLHTYISGLRRALGPARELLDTTRHGYRLRLAEADVDVRAFERHRSAADRLLLVGRLEAAADELSAGLALWRGEAYAAVPGPFAELEGQRLAEARTAAVEQRARVLIEVGRAADIVADADELVREQPLRESARELLVLALHRGGRHAEALAAAEESRRVLASELGISPGPALAGLHAHIRAGGGAVSVGPRRAPGPVLPAAARAALSRDPVPELIGRDDAVRRVRDLLAGVAAGTGRAVWVEGDEGLGRTALLHTALAGAQARGCAIGWGDADELLARFELQVLLNCFDIDLVPGGRLAPGADEDPAEDRLAELVERSCAKAPLVVVVEDLHWADPATIRFWHRLVAMTARLPLLLVATSWPVRGRQDLDLLRGAVDRAGGAVLELTPLTTEDSVSLLRVTTGCATWTAERLAAEAMGNPMRLVELAGSLRGGPEAAKTDWRPPVRSSAAAAHRMLLALPSAVVDVVRTAAVLGVRFAEADLVLVADAARGEVGAAVDTALAAHVLVREHDLLSFRTAPLWRAAYERIPAPIRSPLQRQFTAILAAAKTGD